MNRAQIASAAPPRSAEIVIIGSGVAGLFAARDLRLRGIQDIVIIEAGMALGGLATRASAAMLTTLTGNETTTRLAVESLAAYETLSDQLSREFANPVGFRRCGFAIVGIGPDARAQVRAEHTEHQMLAASEPALRVLAATELGTGADLNELSDGFFRLPDEALVCRAPRDGCLNVGDLVAGLLAELSSMGVQLVANTRIGGIETASNRVTRVWIEGGEHIVCSRVLNAGGVQAGEVAAMVGLELDVIASQKSLFSVSDVGVRFAGPIVEVVDDGWYYRPSPGGLIVGAGLGKAVPISTAVGEQSQPPEDDVHACRSNLALRTNVAPAVLETIDERSGWTGCRPINSALVASLGRADAHLPSVGSTAVGGFYESCAWGEFGITLGPAGGRLVADAITA